MNASHRALLVALGFLTLPSIARAQMPESAPGLLRAGVALRREHRDQEALAAFARANELSPSPMARAQMALARAATSEWLAAEEDLRVALEGASDPWIAANRPALEITRTEIAHHLGWLDLSVDAPGASATLDGQVLAANHARVRAGRAVLEVHAPGYAPVLRAIDVPAESTARLMISLSPLAPSAPVLSSPPAAHTKPAALSFTPLPPKPSSSTAPLLVGAAGLAALGVGSYFGIRAFADKSERDGQCTGLACSREGLAADADGRTSATASTILITTGLVMLTTAATWLLLTHGPSHRLELSRW